MNAAENPHAARGRLGKGAGRKTGTRPDMGRDGWCGGICSESSHDCLSFCPMMQGKIKPLQPLKLQGIYLARREGLEPPTDRFEVCDYIH